MALRLKIASKRKILSKVSPIQNQRHCPSTLAYILHAAKVLINKPHARVTIDQNGTVNVVRAFAPVQKKDQKGKENLLQRLVNFFIVQFKGPMSVKVDLVQLVNFSGDFVDGSITPA